MPWSVARLGREKPDLTEEIAVPSHQKPARVSRRSFLRISAAASALPLLGPRLLHGSPGEALGVAHVGVGGMGRSDLHSVASAKNVRIVALCDVDFANLYGAAEEHPEAAIFKDYRVMLDRVGRDIDAVVVSTPDHMHGSVALAAMSLGKHVYCQKPIAHNLVECRMMAEMAAKQGVVTQMGTQIHSHAEYRTAVATVRAGAIGKVREAHLWVSKSWAGPVEGRPEHTDPVPETLAWDLWLGVAPERPFVKGIYHPASWRGWLDFGGGTLGDMGCHIFDPVFAALGIGAPTSVVSRGPQNYAEAFAPDGDIEYEFPGTERTTETVRLRWTDGSGVSRPDATRAQLPEGVSLPGAGSFLVGERGVMVIPHWSMPKIYRNGEELEIPLEMREAGNHYHEWVDACRGEGETSTPFSFSGPLTEAVLAGTVAGRFKDRPLRFDPKRLRFDDDAANAFVGRSYRKGWEISGR